MAASQVLTSIRNAAPPWLLHQLEAAHTSPAAQAIQQHASDVSQRWLQPALAQVDAQLAELRPWQIVALTVALLLVGSLVCSSLSSAWDSIRQRGLMGSVVAFLRTMPGLSGLVKAEMTKMRKDLMAARGVPPAPVRTCLPQQGTAPADVLQELRKRQDHDTLVAGGNSRLSGSLYMPDSSSHLELLNEAFRMFAVTNPLHADTWPSVRQMEAEVVAMTGSLLGGGPGTSVCGSMTSGGTESILLAMKASRDWARARRGVQRPEILIADSAHAAYVKAAEYFNMRLVQLPVGKDLRLTARAVRGALTRNTAVVVASAPGFPHGVIDDVEGIAKVCRAAGVCLHVDACLGGFVLPFARKLGRPLPRFSFEVKGVTSMSVDTHKFGLAHKGSSVVLYDRPELRAHQFTSITDWTGGLYISPTTAGSRPGALIVCAWAALVAQGEAGYLQHTRNLLAAADRFVEGIRSGIPELRVLGQPDMCLVAFTHAPGTRLNIYQVKDLLARSGWHCNALQNPPALHFCFTAAHIGADGSLHLVDQLLVDLKAACQELIKDPGLVKGGSAPMYGMANVLPDRRMVGEFLVVYQDVQLEP